MHAFLRIMPLGLARVRRVALASRAPGQNRGKISSPLELAEHVGAPQAHPQDRKWSAYRTSIGCVPQRNDSAIEAALRPTASQSILIPSIATSFDRMCGAGAPPPRRRDVAVLVSGFARAMLEPDVLASYRRLVKDIGAKHVFAYLDANGRHVRQGLLRPTLRCRDRSALLTLCCTAPPLIVRRCATHRHISLHWQDGNRRYTWAASDPRSRAEVEKALGTWGVPWTLALWNSSSPAADQYHPMCNSSAWDNHRGVISLQDSLIAHTLDAHSGTHTLDAPS